MWSQEVVTMGSKKRRRRFTADEKAAILRRHLADKVSIADLAEEYGLQPSVLYQWQRSLLDNAAIALEPKRRAQTQEAKLGSRIRELESRVQKKNEVIAEVSEALVQAKKDIGEL